MARARFLAPWHQPDLLAALEEEGRSVEELRALKGKPAIYHCLSRVVDRRFVLGEAEKDQFVRYMRLYERFCQVRVLTFCVMSNHFHILLEVPAVPEDRGESWTDEELLRHLEFLYSEREMSELRWKLEYYRQNKMEGAAKAFRERFFARMW